MLERSEPLRVIRPSRWPQGSEDEARLDTIEVDDELEEFPIVVRDRCLTGPKIRFHIGSALDIAPRLGEIYDLVFIDGDKREYPDYYRMLMGTTAARHSYTAARCSLPTTSSGRERSCSPWPTATVTRRR